ncbi:MAG TPA: hypothetical protein VEG34_06090 [Thermoanaerobaculia bacterium]|nr:hypothetical protein [Thermoanaerobaculia bacterium]
MRPSTTSSIPGSRGRRTAAVLVCAAVIAGAAAAEAPRTVSLQRLVEAVREKARVQQDSAGGRLAYRSFLAANGLAPVHVGAADFAVVRLLFEATRDAGLWNLRWAITDLEPNSDRIWRQWSAVRHPSAAAPTAVAECDELSALFAFLARRAGVRNIGLFWPTSNHTVAAWELRPPGRRAVRVVVPTTQIFLAESDLFGTRRFDPWTQRTIYEYTRRDAPDTLQLPASLVDFFLVQLDKYGGATDGALQRLRYLREGVLQGRLSREQAVARALALVSGRGPGAGVDMAAFRTFAADLLASPAATP